MTYRLSRRDPAGHPLTGRPRVAPLGQLTTLRVGGPASELIFATSREQTIDAVRRADQVGQPLMVLGRGSNVVVGDDGFDGVVVRVATTGRHTTSDGEWAVVTVEAGESWAALVEMCVAEDLSGIECLAAIPGLVGAVPVQNVGAYGQEIANSVINVRAWDREVGRMVDLDRGSCSFGYRTSRFRHHSRWVILSVSFRLRRSKLSERIRYDQLADILGVDVGEQLPLDEVRDAVVSLRRARGMVLDPADPDSRSAGSFFTNPMLSEGELARLRRRAKDRLGASIPVPVFPASDGQTKVPAAWLVEQAGFQRGHRMGDAAISTKHTLALTLRHGHSALPLLTLARTVRRGVHESFGVTLEPEPTLVGVTL